MYRKTGCIGMVLVFIICSILPFVEANNNYNEQVNSEGDMTEYPVSAGCDGGIAVNKNGTMFICKVSANTIVKYSESGSEKDYSVPKSINGASPSAMGDGNAICYPANSALPHRLACYDNSGNGVCTIYYTSEYNPVIGKMTETGTITKYASSTALGLCVNKNGTVFVCHYQNNRIGKLTNAGVYSYYSVPASPQDIAVNSNGTLYFTTFDGDVYRLYESGSYKLICSAGVSGATSIVINKNNTIYIGSCNDGNIVRIYESGSHYHYFFSWSGVFQMALNNNSVIYFTTGKNMLGKMTESGSFTRFTTPSNYGAWYLCINKNGTVWFPYFNYAKMVKMAGATLYSVSPPIIESEMALELTRVGEWEKGDADYAFEYTNIPATIKAIINSTNQTDTVELKYRKNHETNYTDLKMVLTEGDKLNGIWAVTIPPVTDSGEVSYVITANTTTGNTISTPECHMEIIKNSVPEATMYISFTVVFGMVLIAIFYKRK